MIKARILFLLVFFALSISMSSAQESRTQTREELIEEIRDHEELILKYPNSEYSPRLYFQLSDLFIRKARLDFEISMVSYESQLEDYKNNKTIDKPVLPVISNIPAITILEKLLTKYPTSGFNDKTTYQLALCYQERGDEEKSREYFESLIKYYPLSNLYPEAYFRLGEHYFNKNDDEKAISYYKRLVDADMWSNPFYDMSLYKLGWSYYRINRYPEAISSFMFLLKDLRTLERIQTQKLDLIASDLKNEAVTYIAVSFTEYAEPEDAFRFLSSFSDSSNKYQILEKLASVYFQHDLLDEAIKTYNYLIAEFPKNQNAPVFSQKIIEVYEKKFDLSKANSMRGELIDYYKPGSEWFTAQKDSVIKEETLSLIRNDLYTKGVYHQQQAREKADKDLNYRVAIDQYKYFLTLFPQDSLAYKINYYLAEAYYSTGNYEEAGNEYKNCYKNYPANEFTEKAAFNCIISYNKALENEMDSELIPVTINRFFNVDSLVTIQVGNIPTKEFLLGCHEYAERYPLGGRVVEVLMKEAEVLNKLQYPNLARHIFQKIIAEHPNHPQKSKAMILVAQSFFQEENFKEAEKWYGTVSSSFADSLKLVDRARTMMSTSVFKIAENYKKNGEFALAAKEFRNIALKYPATQITKNALIEAGQMFEANGQTVKSAELFESFIKENPNSEITTLCALYAAKYREKISDWINAAKDYLIAKHSTSGLPASASLFSAGICYTKAKDWNSSINIFEAYVQTGEDQNKVLEAQCRVGLAWFELEQLENAKSAFELTVNKYNLIKDESKLNTYFPANAQFMLAEFSLIEFLKIDLSPPFKESLNKKSISLRSVLKAYSDAAKFRIFEWTTASSFKIGKVFEKFANAILVSTLPKDLATYQEIISYEAQLWKLARPFQKKALEAHLSNVKQANANNIENTWTKLSRERIVFLNDTLNNNKVSNP